MNMSRSITEILKEADSTNDLQCIINLWNEIAYNKYKYSLVQIRFAKEYIRESALKSNGSDVEIGKFYWSLEEMYSGKVVS